MASEQAATLLLVLAVILLLSRVLGALAKRLGQPAVIGEIIAGILVGPTLFGGTIATTLFPAAVRSPLSALADLGVTLFMFTVGLGLDRSSSGKQGRTTVTVAVSSMAVPFGLGCVLALHLAGRHPSDDIPGFVLFMGAAMSATAFPVLARILADRGMLRTEIGGLALSSAAVVDVLAWCLLAVVVANAGGEQSWRFLLVVPFVAFMFLIMRPLLRRLAGAGDPAGGITQSNFAIVLAGLLVSAALTEWMGLHFIFGAFLFGLVMPRNDGGRLRAETRNRLEHVCSALLLPIYFVVAGLQVDLSRIGGADLAELGLIMTVAVVGKFAGTFLAGGLCRIPTRQTLVLGILMNTRGLTELVILTVGLQLGVLDRDLYSLMVVMAVVTTAMASVLLSWFAPPSGVQRDVTNMILSTGGARVDELRRSPGRQTS